MLGNESSAPLASDESALHSRLAALLFSDIVDSTGMKSRVSTAAYTASLKRHNARFEESIAACRDGKIIKHTGDGFFAQFQTASDAARCALQFQRALANESWPGESMRTRVGIHMGEIAMVRMLDRTDIVGSPADVAARIMSLGQGGQILMSKLAADEAKRFIYSDDTRWIRHGHYKLKGVEDPIEIWEVADSASPAIGAPTAARSTTPGHPEHIGPYRILELLGMGGMGEVYKAERRSPIRQTVAIKIIKLGFDTRDVIARFESERQALARMDHPHVARVLDAGTTDTGRPYFVMDYVAGQPITKFADQKKLTIKDRLLLFTQVCDAISHAHAKAIIHRDIKASNILACLQDGKPTVKVIDFGIAKAVTGDKLTDRTFNTGRGEALGTYESMSPEQADGSPDIDSRTDVYALGVLLYELLTGAQPFDKATMAKVADEEIRRIIREVDPPRLSTRLTSLGESATNVAALRCEQLEALCKELSGELEWIPLKAMRKDRDRRYTSPARLADDISNYLSHRPLIAGPESRVYRVRKFLKRKKSAVAAVAAIIIVAAVGTIGTVSQMRRADRFEAILNSKVVDSPPAPGSYAAPVGKPVTEMLTSAGRFSDGEAKLRRAAENIQRGDVPPSREALQRMSNYAMLLSEQYRYEDAGKWHREVLKLRRQVLGESDEDTLGTLTNLGVLLLAQRRPNEAEPFLVEVLDRNVERLGRDDPKTLTAMNNVAALRQSQPARRQDAVPLFRETFERRKQVLGENNRDTLLSMNSYGAILRDVRDFQNATPILEEALRRRTAAFGDLDRDTLQSMHDIGALLREQNRTQEAEPIIRRTLELRQQVLGRDNLDTIGSQNYLSLVLRQNGKYASAAPLSRDLYERVPLTQLPPDVIAAYTAGHSICLAHLGQWSDAEPLLNEALQRLQRAGRKNGYVTREVVAALKLVYENTGRPDEAARLSDTLKEMHATTRLTSSSASQPSTAPTAGN